MITFVGYENFTQIHDSVNSQVYRAQRISDKPDGIATAYRQSVILKLLNQEYPTPEQIRRYKQEYKLIRQLDDPGIIKAYSLDPWQRSYAIVLEDFEGISLKQWLQDRPQIPLAEFLQIAIATTESLGQIHAHNIIHKDINPANIIFNPETQELKIIDFGIATQLSRENPILKNPNILEGTLVYISPEQTGRMNRALDYRTDFYSLGVTFYEILTGKVPFVGEDAMEVIHCHLAKSPPIPDAQFPTPIIGIILKLMAKNAEDRYQSIWGLKADLERCLQQLKETGEITPFTLGQQDISDRFQISQKLYGRDREIETLLTAFDRVAQTGQVELMLVAGYSGLGKSALVQELYKPITARRGYFISGKFDQFQRNIPYSALVGAFRGLMNQLLGESEAQLQVWRDKLLQVLGNQGQVIIDVIPEVELIIGKQPSIPTLEANESENRFNLVFKNFIQVFCSQQHPLTLFIDDLQWVDFGTLKLLEQILCEGQTEYLLLLGAYRDNEVDSGHLLSLSIARMRQQNAVIQEIDLKPLPFDEISGLICDTLQDSHEAIDLARLVASKTGGNAFFVKELLQALYREELIQFNRQTRQWQWDIAEIEVREFSDNVVELMVNQLQKLPSSSQEILSLAACWGGEFNLNLLTWITQKSPSETFELLKIPLDSGFILPLSELDENLLIQSYKFGHDRIQQAAYALIPDEQKDATHYQIGRVLLEKFTPEAREENLFELVSQLNYGTALITAQPERDELAQFNLVAGRKARDTAVYEVARQYANTGLLLLGENAWERQYKMSLDLHNLAAELAVLCGESEQIEPFFQTIVGEARSLLDRVNVYKLQIRAYNSQDRQLEALNLAQKTLQDFGLSLPENPTQEDTLQALTEVMQLIENGEIERLVDLPIMEDEEKIALLQIINSVVPSAFSSGSPLLPLLIALSVKLSIQYGNTANSCFAYALYGYIYSKVLQDVDTGVRFSQVALKLLFKLDANVMKPEVMNVVGAFLLHRKYHTKDTLSLLQEGYAIAVEYGNHQFAGFCCTIFCLNSIWCSQPLSSLEQESRAYYHKLTQLNQLHTAHQCRIYWQYSLNLLGLADRPAVLSGEALPEEKLQSSSDDVSWEAIFSVHQLMLSYLFEDLETAQKYAEESRRNFAPIDGLVIAPAFYFYDSLVALAAINLDLEDTSEALQRVEENQNQLQSWAEYAPMNYQHKVDLVAAEKCRVLGQKAEAIELYNQAISGANQYNYIQEEALANELLAEFYLDWHQEKVARVYMMDAHYCYSRWEAIAKVKQLEENYPQLCQSSTVGTATTSKSATVNQSTSYFTTSNSSSQLDLSTMMKASQAITGEIVLSRLLTQLIQIMVENTGARSGYLILETEGEFLIEAAASADGEIAVLQSMSLESVKPDGSSPLLCPAIVNYVARTHESVVLHDDQHGGNFTTQSYIQNFSVKSVLCVPLLNQGQLRGVVYLENNLTTGAFTQERVEIVKLLSGQAAIAITNAKLYTEVKQSEQRLIQFLEAIPVGVSIHKVTGQLHYANQTAQQLLGINIAPEAKTEEIAEAYQVYRAGTEDLYPNEELPVVRSLAGETVKADDLELHQPDRILPIEVSSTPIFDKTGKVVYGIAAFQDITERKEAEKLLIDYNKSLEKQLALSLENTQLYAASKRFVPEQFLSFLDKQSIVDVELGDRVQREMTVLFSDIRDFTTISEQMSPEENFAFINEYLGYMEPQIQKYGGFIDKYIGDAIMALFPSSPDDAVSGAISMLEELKQYNSHRQEQNLFPVRIGIGLHTGMLMLGTVGGMGRMDGTVIGDAVNLSSRVEGLTKTYGAAFLITYQTWQSLNNPNDYEVRFIDKVKAKGKTEAVGLLEVFSAEPPELKSAKIATRTKFEKAVIFYHTGSFQEAASLFQECLEYHPGDRAAQIYLDRCLTS